MTCVVRFLDVRRIRKARTSTYPCIYFINFVYIYLIMRLLSNKMKLCRPRISRQVSMRQGMLRYNGITASFVKLNSFLALGLIQLAFNVC